MDNKPQGDDETAVKRILFNESVAGNIPSLRFRTVTLIYQNDEGAVTQGAGTLLAIGPRLFVITAGHVVTDNTLPSYWLLTPEIRNMEDMIVTPVCKEAHSDYDIGFLELAADSATHRLPESTPCGLGDLAPRGCGRDARSTILVGPPSDNTSFNRDGPRQITLKATAMTYWTVPLQPDEWASLRTPNDPNDRPLDPAVDIVMDYDPNQVQYSSNGERMPLPRPHGMSGGGIWDQNFITDQVWDASSPKLIGVQSSWFSKGKYLRGIQIIHALRLIHSRYGELRPLLHEAYGEQYFSDCPPPPT